MHVNAKLTLLQRNNSRVVRLTRRSDDGRTLARGERDLATTIEELRVKARATLWACCGELDFDDGIHMQAIKSVIEDLLAA